MSAGPIAERIAALARRAQAELEADASSAERHLPALLKRAAADGARARPAWLNPVCRRLSLGRRLWADYGEGWSKAPGSPPLPATGWAVLVAVLLREAVAEDAERGWACKCLNAALQAIDAAAREGVGLPGDLAAAADAVLERLAPEAAGE